MVASQNQRHSLYRHMGNAHNGSLPAYGAEGEMNAQMNEMRRAVQRLMGGATWEEAT